MRVIVVGLGVQGYKRKRFAGDDFVADVDLKNMEAKYRKIEDVPLHEYDAAMLCVPDGPKIELLNYLIEHGKHALIEKPLWATTEEEIATLEAHARNNGVVCYTAYNHRFEPHFMRMKEVLQSRILGEVYRCRLFYGNGTARLVKDSAWRDCRAGVLPDLGSHLLDTITYWFGTNADDFKLQSVSRFENKAPDHVVVSSESSRPKIEMEMTLLMWRNHFTCDVLAEKGSAHIESLCKWGPSTFTLRKRVLPSGRPEEDVETLVLEDPTWSAEYNHFKALCQDGHKTDLSQDRWLMATLGDLASSIEDFES